MCTRAHGVLEESIGGRKCNVRLNRGPSSHWFRQAGLDLITFNFPPAITFPVDHFPSPVRVCTRACAYTSVFSCEPRQRKERKMKKEKCMFSRPKCLWWMRWLCKPWATSFVIWFQWHSHLEVESIWFSALTEWLAWCVRKYVGPACKKLNTSKEPLRGPSPFPSEASMEHLTG